MRHILSCVAVVLLAVSAYANKADTKGFEKSLALGLTLTDGNTKTTLTTLRFVAERITAPHEFKATLEGAYGETDNDTSAENVRAGTTYRRLLSERMYATFDLVGNYDAQSDIDYRFIASPGLGYFWINSDTVRLSTDFGPAYVVEKIDGERDDYPALRLAERLEVQLSETAKCWQSLEYVPQTEEFDTYLLNAELGVEAALNSRLNLQVTLKNSYNSEPAEDSKKNDLSLVAALAVSL